MTKTYCIRHLGLFSRPLLTTSEDGFSYKGHFYTRKDIKRVVVTGGRGQPMRMGVHLSNGKIILINASALERNGEKAKTGFFSGNNEIFDELREFFENLPT